jgi:hypothetical protein
MKGLFNKTLVIALLVSVCGIRAEVTDMSGKQLFVAAATQLSQEAKDAAVAGLNVVKNSDFARLTGNSFKYAGSVVVNGAHAVFAKMAPVVAKQTEALKFVAGKISSAGSVAKNGAVKAAELSKPALVAALGYALRAKDGAKSFYANHTDACQIAAFVTAYFGFCVYVDCLNKQARMNREMQNRRDTAHEIAQANQVTEATQVDMNELNSDVIA